MNKLYYVLLILVLAGCASKPVEVETVERHPFPLNEYSKLEAYGTGVLRGSGYRKIGKTIIAVKEATANPVTSYSRFWYEEHVIGGKNIGPADERYYDYIREAEVDEHGNFIFTNLPPGDYYLVTKVYESEEPQPGYKVIPTMKGATYHTVTVRNGEVTFKDVTE